MSNTWFGGNGFEASTAGTAAVCGSAANGIKDELTIRFVPKTSEADKWTVYDFYVDDTTNAKYYWKGVDENSVNVFNVRSTYWGKTKSWLEYNTNNKFFKIENDESKNIPLVLKDDRSTLFFSKATDSYSPYEIWDRSAISTSRQIKYKLNTCNMVYFRYNSTQNRCEFASAWVNDRSVYPDPSTLSWKYNDFTVGPCIFIMYCGAGGGGAGGYIKATKFAATNVQANGQGAGGGGGGGCIFLTIDLKKAQNVGRFYYAVSLGAGGSGGNSGYYFEDKSVSPTQTYTKTWSSGNQGWNTSLYCWAASDGTAITYTLKWNYCQAGGGIGGGSSDRYGVYAYTAGSGGTTWNTTDKIQPGNNDGTGQIGIIWTANGKNGGTGGWFDEEGETEHAAESGKSYSAAEEIDDKIHKEGYRGTAAYGNRGCGTSTKSPTGQFSVIENGGGGGGAVLGYCSSDASSTLNTSHGGQGGGMCYKFNPSGTSDLAPDDGVTGSPSCLVICALSQLISN